MCPGAVYWMVWSTGLLFWSLALQFWEIFSNYFFHFVFSLFRDPYGQIMELLELFSSFRNISPSIFWSELLT